MSTSNSHINMMASSNPKYLIWGGKGWVAEHIYSLLKSQGAQVFKTTVRMEDRAAVLAELKSIQPTHVLNCAGVTGRPNVDWCEDNREATIRSNVIGTLNLADCCFLSGVHCTIFATGCIYQYDTAHPIGSNIGFKETDTPNFAGSYYSATKAHTEALLEPYLRSNVLVLRLRMPISDDLHPRSFVTKITKYAKVVDVPNSVTHLPTLLPLSILLASHHTTGIYNFTNPGSISHNEVLTLYRDIVDPTFSWKNFSLEEQAHVIKAGRSNCMLDTGKLEAKVKEFGVDLRQMGVREVLRAGFGRMAEWKRSQEGEAAGKGIWMGKENEVTKAEGGAV